MELEAIRALIRAKMQDGRLPRDSGPQALGHPGNLENCGACGRVLRTSRLMMEVRKSTMAFFFHGDCYLLWIDERRAPVVTSSAFALLA
jgi:hypothetical protein